MKINVNKTDLDKIYKLLDTKRLNIAAGDVLFDFINASREIEGEYSEEEYLSIVKDYLEIDESLKEDNEFYLNYIKPAIKPISVENYKDFAYLKALKVQNTKYKEYSLKNEIIKAYQAVPYDDIKVDSDYYYQELSQIGYFKEDFPIITLNKNGITWMSTDPCELNTMKPYIELAKGHVVVFGLGLGYYPYMISLKNEVKSVTVVELDENVIDIFNKFIRPKLHINKDFKIIHDDAFKFIKKNDLSKQFDFAFIDIYHSAEDGLALYLQFKELEEKNIIYKYWLEESVVALYRRCLLTVVEESLEGFSDKDYQHSKNDIDKIINSIYFKTKNLEIHSFGDLLLLLNSEVL